MQVQVKGPVERRGGIARSARRPFARDARRIGLAVDRPDDLAPLPDDAEDMKTVERRRQRGLVTLIFVVRRSEEHTSELQSLMRISYAVFCLKKKQHAQKYQQ